MRVRRVYQPIWGLSWTWGELHIYLLPSIGFKIAWRVRVRCNKCRKVATLLCVHRLSYLKKYNSSRLVQGWPQFRDPLCDVHGEPAVGDCPDETSTPLQDKFWQHIAIPDSMKFKYSEELADL